MRRNPERLAWLVLLTAFAIFCLTVTGVPLSVRWYVRNAEKRHEASVEALVGTIVVEPPVGRGAIPLTQGESMVVPEGTIIRVDETSEAVVTFLDHSFVRLFPGATVRIERLRAPRFRGGVHPVTVLLDMIGGRGYIGTALSLDTSLDLRVKTLHAESLLEADGSYAVESRNDRSEVYTYRGRAIIASPVGQVTLESGQRTQVMFDQAPNDPVSLARSLVDNEEFRRPLTDGWRVFNDQGTDGGDVDGKAEIVVDEGRRAVRFTRTGGHGNHCETILEQTINERLPDPITSLMVRATVKVRHQSLSGGGYLSSEYPLMIRITYRDVYDSEAEWVQGFYYQNTAGNPTMFGLQIPQDRWYPFESGNLLNELPVRPYRIIAIRVYASGWDYESLVSDVNLIVE
jgi:hypothetical protein